VVDIKHRRIISYGGGVQSTAMIVLSAQGRIPPIDAAIMANVGDDSEHPATLVYVREVMLPWAAKNGVHIEVMDRVKRNGDTETLMGRLTREGSRSLPIPIRMDNGAPGTRSCTADFKIAVVGKWLKKHGATAENPFEVCIGISTDEIQRVSNKKSMPYEKPIYPLIDVSMDRSRCQQVIAAAGLPVPPKSSCFFCPFHRPQVWAEMRRDEPELFEKSAALEDLLNERRDELGKDHVYLTRFAKPLREAIPEAQNMLPIFDVSPDIETCDEGYCFT